jgi:hypothetical protein
MRKADPLVLILLSLSLCANVILIYLWHHSVALAEVHLAAKSSHELHYSQVRLESFQLIGMDEKNSNFHLI